MLFSLPQEDGDENLCGRFNLKRILAIEGMKNLIEAISQNKGGLSMKVDLNCDLGESPGAYEIGEDERILDLSVQ